MSFRLQCSYKARTNTGNADISVFFELDLREMLKTRDLFSRFDACASPTGKISKPSLNGDLAQTMGIAPVQKQWLVAFHIGVLHGPHHVSHVQSKIEAKPFLQPPAEALIFGVSS